MAGLRVCLVIDHASKWAVSRRYMSLEPLGSLSDEPVRRGRLITLGPCRGPALNTPLSVIAGGATRLPGGSSPD
jgi:hypothetical protein